MRVFLGIHEICGHYKNLEKGMRELGHQADFISVVPNNLFYGDNSQKSKIVRMWQSANGLRASTPRSRFFKKTFTVLFAKILNMLMTLYVAKKYDVLFFGYGMSITNSSWELWLYKKLNKNVNFIFHGSDSRPPYLAGRFCNTEDVNYEAIRTTAEKTKENIKRIEKYATNIINWMPQAYFHERKYVNLLSLGLAVDIEYNYSDEVEGFDSKKPVRVLHCPSSANKSTDAISVAINNLKNKGHNIDFVVVSGKPNEEVLTEICKCDFLVDSLYSDNPLATLAVEAAKYGKPTVVGGYLYNEIGKWFPKGIIPPVLYVHPKKIENGIEKLITETEFRLDLGRKAFDYVNTEWSLKQIAKNYILLAQGAVSEDWVCDPLDIDYMQGVIAEDRAKDVVRNMIQIYGVESLQLSDKPKLLKAFIEFSM